MSVDEVPRGRWARVLERVRHPEERSRTPKERHVGE
jgi:hypothetical protein